MLNECVIFKIVLLTCQTKKIKPKIESSIFGRNFSICNKIPNHFSCWSCFCAEWFHSFSTQMFSRLNWLLFWDVLKRDCCYRCCLRFVVVVFVYTCWRSDTVAHLDCYYVDNDLLICRFQIYLSILFALSLFLSLFYIFILVFFMYLTFVNLMKIVI